MTSFKRMTRLECLKNARIAVAQTVSLLWMNEYVEARLRAL